MKHEGIRTTLSTFLCAWVALFLSTRWITGCGAAALPGDGTNPGTPQTPVEPSDNEPDVGSTIVPDAPFENARVLTLTGDATETVDGTIGSRTTIGVFDLGPLDVGDRLVASVEATGSLDPVLGIFDANGDVLVVNDDRNYYGGDLNCSIDMQVRRQTDHGFVAVASSDGSNTTGDYNLSVRRVAGGAVPETHPQVVYLNFDGASGIVIGRRPPAEIPRFEGSLIGEEFTGRTDELIAATVEQIRRNYVGLDVEFVSSREGAPPVGPYTTIHFGAYDPGLLGLADYVDEFNIAETQKAIVFVDTFQAFLILNPSVEEMATALSNVASHETGHLLGLYHMSDVHAIMDITANLRQMMAVQTFCRSNLHREVFPVGFQDTAKLLVEAVGGDLEQVKAAAAQTVSQRAVWYDQGEPIPARLTQPFSICACPTCGKHRQRAAAPDTQ